MLIKVVYKVKYVCTELYEHEQSSVSGWKLKNVKFKPPTLKFMNIESDWSTDVTVFVFQV